MSETPRQENDQAVDATTSQPGPSAKEGPWDRLIMSLLCGLAGAFVGGAIAWATFADTAVIVRSAVVGFLAMAAFVWLMIGLSRPFARQPADAFTYATGPDAPAELGEAVRGALQRQKGYTGLVSLKFVVYGLLIGGGIGWSATGGQGGAAWIGALWGALIGGVLGFVFGFLLESGLTAGSIVLVRKLGVLGYAIQGAVCGALLGLVLWNRFGEGWSPVGAAAIGLPMAVLFAFAGWQRRRKRQP